MPVTQDTADTRVRRGGNVLGRMDGVGGVLAGAVVGIAINRVERLAAILQAIATEL